MHIKDLIEHLEQAYEHHGNLAVVVDNDDDDYYCDLSNGVSIAPVDTDEYLHKPQSGDHTEEVFCINLF